MPWWDFYYLFFTKYYLLSVTISLNKKFVVWCDFIIYFAWNKKYCIPTCACKQVDTSDVHLEQYC